MKWWSLYDKKLEQFVGLCPKPTKKMAEIEFAKTAEAYRSMGQGEELLDLEIRSFETRARI